MVKNTNTRPILMLDRNLYRPGEGICIKGYLRHISMSETEQFYKHGIKKSAGK